MIIDMIKKGQVKPEIINGEVKMQFNLVNNIPEFPGKNIPFIVMNITNYNDEG